ncbi:MAG: hypothetical protein GXO92_00430 [FCB group bacterium]|nr:hypothetical protein [FCB group bacterium]
MMILLGTVQARQKPVIALMDFVNNTGIDLVTIRSPEYHKTLTNMIREAGIVDVRTGEDLELIAELNNRMDLFREGEEIPIQVLNLKRDRQNHLLAQGVDYYGFGVWTTNDNMVFKAASFSLTLFLVDIETREVITVTRAIDNDALPLGRNPLVDPPALDNIDKLLADVADEVSVVLTLPEEEREFRYEIRQLENEATGRRNGKKLLLIGVGMLGFTQGIGALIDATFLQILAFDGYSFVIYLGLRDIYLGKEIRKQVAKLKKIYRRKYKTEI